MNTFTDKEALILSGLFNSKKMFGVFRPLPAFNFFIEHGVTGVFWHRDRCINIYIEAA